LRTPRGRIAALSPSLGPVRRGGSLRWAGRSEQAHAAKPWIHVGHQHQRIPECPVTIQNPPHPSLSCPVLSSFFSAVADPPQLRMPAQHAHDGRRLRPRALRHQRDPIVASSQPIFVEQRREPATPSGHAQEHALCHLGPRVCTPRPTYYGGMPGLERRRRRGSG
jgi:hypothetical protein